MTFIVLVPTVLNLDSEEYIMEESTYIILSVILHPDSRGNAVQIDQVIHILMLDLFLRSYRCLI